MLSFVKSEVVTDIYYGSWQSDHQAGRWREVDPNTIQFDAKVTNDGKISIRPSFTHTHTSGLFQYIQIFGSLLKLYTSHVRIEVTAQLVMFLQINSHLSLEKVRLSCSRMNIALGQSHCTCVSGTCILTTVCVTIPDKTFVLLYNTTNHYFKPIILTGRPSELFIKFNTA